MKVTTPFYISVSNIQRFLFSTSLLAPVVVVLVIVIMLLLSRFTCAWLFTTPWTAAHQAPPSMGFSRQEYWTGVPLPSPNSHPSECKMAYHCHFPLRFLNGWWIIGSTVQQHYDIAFNSNFCTNITDSIGWRQGGSSWKTGFKTGG